MKQKFFTAAVLVLLLAFSAAVGDTPGANDSAASKPKMLVGYYPNWAHYSGFTADKIRYDYLTHILYAFYISDNSGNLSNSDPLDAANFKLLTKLAKQHGVKVLLSIGGASQSDGFKAVAASPRARANFIKNAIKVCDEYGLAGFDIDWEFPVEGDGANEEALFKEVRAAIDKHTPKLLFTAAVPATAYWAHWSPDAVFQQLDYLNVMTYDYMGTWEKHILPNSGMKQSEHALDYYVKKRGVPSSKLLMGDAFYGKAFDSGTGMGSNYAGIGSGSDGSWEWKDLLKQFQAVPYKVMWDPQEQSEYALGNDEIIVFNGIPSTRVRGEYVRKSDYAGVMLWDLSGDTLDRDKSLLVALYRGLRGTDRGPLQLPPSGPAWTDPEDTVPN